MTNYIETVNFDGPVIIDTFGPAVDPIAGDTWTGNLGPIAEAIDPADRIFINVVAGVTYTFSIDVSSNSGLAPISATTEIDGETVSASQNDGSVFEFTFTATTTGEQTIFIATPDDSASVEYVVNFAAEVLPPPSGEIIIGTDESETLLGTGRDDSIEGNDGNDLIRGRSGDDYIDGGRHNDIIYAGAGEDEVYGGHADDFIRGDNGDDLIFGGSGGDSITGGRDNDEIYGGHGADRIGGGSGDDFVDGGVSSDMLFGNIGNDTLYGDRGNDRLFGGSGDDQLFGGTQSDRLYGGGGNDILEGGRSDDRLTGGGGSDAFVFAGTVNTDVITDFSLGEDLIDISAYGPMSAADILASISGTGNAVVDLGAAGEIRLIGVAADDLTIESFLYFPDDIFIVG